MLITLKTTSRDDTSRFSNFFPEGLKIPPDAELGLVNISYNINKPIAIGADNKTFQVRLGNQTVFSDITILEATYDNVAALATAMETALQAWVLTQSAHIQSLFPSDKQTVIVSKGHIITIQLVYDQQSLPLQKWSGFNSDNIGNVQGEKGGFVNASLLPGATPTKVVPKSGSSNFVLAATHQIGKDFFAVWQFQAPDASQAWVGAESYIYLGSTPDSTRAEARIVLKINYQAGTITVEEMVGDTLTDVLSAGPFTYTPEALFEIRIPLFTDQAIKQNATYFQDNVEVPSKASGGGTNRLDISFNDKFFPVFEPYQSPKMGVIAPGAATDAITSSQINGTDEGVTGYFPGFLAAQQGSSGSGTGAEVMVLTVDANNCPLTFIWLKYGTGHADGDVLDFRRPDDGATGYMFIEITGLPEDSYELTTPGTTYTAGDKDISNIDGTAWAYGPAPRITVTETGGVIQTIVMVSGYGFTEGTEYKIDGGDGTARITINGAINEPVSIVGFKGSVSQVVDDEDPLESQDVISVNFNQAPLRELLDVNSFYTEQFKGGLTITGNGPVVHNNTSSHILHVQVDEFELESREAQKENAGGVNGKTIASLCAGQEAPGGTQEGFFYKEQFNIIYNKLHNPQTVNHNELNIRLTDEENNPFVGLTHPVILTLDLKPDLK